MASELSTQLAVKKTEKTTLVAPAVVAVLSLFLSFWRLGTSTWNVDELGYARLGREYIHGNTSHGWQHPPFAKYMFGISESIFHSNVWGTRIVVALCCTVIGVVLFFFARKLFGQTAGLFAALLWAAFPHVATSGIQSPRLDRFGFLDVPSAMFAFLALFVVMTRPFKSNRTNVLVVGISVGLATASKLSGVLIIPAIFVVYFFDYESWALRISNAVSTAAMSLVVFFATYIPFGSDATNAFKEMFKFQSEHNEEGHKIFLAGHVYKVAPWWTHIYNQFSGDGLLAAVTLIALAVVATFVIKKRDRIGAVTAIVGPLVIMSAARVALPHYRYLWQPPLFLLAGIGLAWVLKLPRNWLAIKAIAVAAVIVVGLSTTWKIATIHQSDYSKAASVVQSLHFDSGTAVMRGYPQVLHEYFPRVDSKKVEQPGNVDFVLVDTVRAKRFPADEVIQKANSLGFKPHKYGRVTIWLPPTP